MKSLDNKNGSRFRLSSFRIALIYAVIGGLWILLSDRALSALVGDPGLLTRIQTYKGWLYVIVTAGLLHWLIRRHMAEHRQADLALQESEKRFRAIFEQAAVGVAQIETLTGRFVRVNRRYCEITGLGPEEMTAATFMEITHPENLQSDLDNMEKLKSGMVRHFSMNTRYLRRDGSAVWVNLAVSPLWLPGERPDYHIAVVENITERKKTQDQIISLNRELELRVSERTEELEHQAVELHNSRLALMNLVDDLNRKTGELEHANARLKEVDRLKSLFIASMSHELRTPLNSIIGFSSILLNGWNGPVNEEQKQNLATVLKSGKHLLALVNDVIDVSKIEAGTIDSHIENFDLHDVLVDLRDMFGKDAAGRELTFSVDAIHHSMRTDRRRLLQCLINLVSNALKFTEAGSVQVKARICTMQDAGSLIVGRKDQHHASRRASQDDDAVEISVIDTGIGIAKEDLSRLFQSFLRLDTPLRTRVLGTGLGLYLTKKLVTEILRGVILVRSEPAHGSSFAILLPTRIDA